MAEIVDAAYALRIANHLHTRLSLHGVPQEDLDRLREIREYLRGAAALDIIARLGDRAHTMD